MNPSEMEKLIETQKSMIANQQGQIDALKGESPSSDNAAYQNGYAYQYASGEQQSAMQGGF